jgi:gamma-glutamylcyclotransferase (GGCT)/AIG2-like uncharacterized protein YtfP
MKHFYFAYGMNTNLTSMANRCPGAVPLGSAILSGYRFVFRSHADVVLDGQTDTHGVLWEITDDHLDRLDSFEGFPHYYLRCRAWVQHNDDWIIAWVYTMHDQDYVSEPEASYVRMCREGYKENGVSTDQIDQALAEIADETEHYF